MNTKPIKVALYARVSTTDQRADLQLDALRQLAEQRGWTIHAEYVDAGYSGRNDRRPALDRLMADARRGKFHIAAVWRFDRFGRSLRHLVTALDEFGDLEIQFVSCSRQPSPRHLCPGSVRTPRCPRQRRTWGTAKTTNLAPGMRTGVDRSVSHEFTSPCGRCASGRPLGDVLPGLSVALNRDKPDRWKADTGRSVDLYNDWFMRFAPTAFRTERAKTTEQVKAMFDATNGLEELTPTVLKKNPRIIFSLRMSTCPPIARDRLIGLAQVNKNLVGCLEEGRLPPRMSLDELERGLTAICDKIHALLDTDLLPWVGTGKAPDEQTRDRSASVIADRLCGALADPIIRNAQEQRQLDEIARWLGDRGYHNTPPHDADKHPKTMSAGTFAFRMIVRVGATLDLNIPIDVVVQPKKPRKDGTPILIEAKSAGDFANVNKRRKEESDKMGHLKARLGKNVPYVLFLCGYFDSGYLGYEAAEGIDWVWEHRIDDLAGLGL